MDYESVRSQKLGCWDGSAAVSPVLNALTTTQSTPDFAPNDDYCNFLCTSGFGESNTPELTQFWTRETKANYAGDEGRRRLRMCGINLKSRDGLHDRLFDVTCPVLWMHGTADAVYSVANAQEEIEMFVNAKSKELKVVEGGAHFLSATHPKEVSAGVVNFIKQNA